MKGRELKRGIGKGSSKDSKVRCSKMHSVHLKQKEEGFNELHSSSQSYLTSFCQCLQAIHLGLRARRKKNSDFLALHQINILPSVYCIYLKPCPNRSSMMTCRMLLLPPTLSYKRLDSMGMELDNFEGVWRRKGLSTAGELQAHLPEVKGLRQGRNQLQPSCRGKETPRSPQPISRG